MPAVGTEERSRNDGSMPRRPAQVCPGCQARCQSESFCVGPRDYVSMAALAALFAFSFFSPSPRRSFHTAPSSIIPHGSIDASPATPCVRDNFNLKDGLIYAWPAYMDHHQVYVTLYMCLSRDTIYNCPPGSPLRSLKA